MKALSPGELAVMAGCGFPDSNESIGAKTLTGIRDDVAECVLGGWWTEDSAYELADNAPSVYTAIVWAQFVDLTLYNFEDDGLDELGNYANLTAIPTIAVYKMALTLINSLAYRYNLEEA